MSLADEPGERRGLLPRFTLKDGNTFLLADALGDIQGSDDGLFLNDTRMLSRFELGVADRRPSLLGAAISQDNTVFRAHLTNSPLPALGERAIPKGVIHIERIRFLWDACLYERLKLTNFSDHDADLPLRMGFAADFADIFEVQGHVRPEKGVLLPPRVDRTSFCLSYRGRDDVVRATHVGFSEIPTSISASEVAFTVRLPRGGEADLFVEISGQSGASPSRARFEAALEASSASMRERAGVGASIGSSGRLFNLWIEKSRADLALLTTALPTGPYPYAGIPWFATQFGRDAIITSLQTLWVNPQLAAGVLRFLASTQAQSESTFRDSQPGKIMHETRRGEMASLREVPFGQYYGGVDTTPLFVMLAGAYERCTGDGTVVDEIWDNLLAAVGWIEMRLESSNTGFLDYARGEQTGLANQAWKDSQDSMFHADGRLPRGPLAVVEVQGYAFAALLAMSELAAARKDPERSAKWRLRAARLRGQIEARFWVEEMGFYALAIDGENQPCRVYASNAGHLLFCGVPSPERAATVTEKLLSERFCSGWGIRTLALGEPRFNPMSYHNGSVWPHDTSLCVAGIARYGGRPQAVKILSQMFEAADHFAMRLPELYCGFPRLPGQGPTPYPVACLPQAWSSGAIFMLLQACLGFEIDGRSQQVQIGRPLLPIGIESVKIESLPVGSQRIDLEFRSVDSEVVAIPARHQQCGVRVLSQL
jgi:glycogen debranching enzyme